MSGMVREHFADRLTAAIEAKQSRVCVGLDPSADRVPPRVRAQATGEVGPGPAADAHALWLFNRALIEAVAPYAAAVKPQSAYYEVHGSAGIAALERTIAYAHEAGLLCILDGKRNDIASTAQAYAEAYLGGGPLGCDALTVNPYLGSDGIRPFAEAAAAHGRGLFVLVKTSNPSSAELQDLTITGSRARAGGTLHEHVARLVSDWGAAHVGQSGYSLVGAVVGGTHPEVVAELRRRLPHTWFLVPGFGAQGAGSQEVAAAFDGNGRGAIVNSSRGIIYAHQATDLSRAYAPEEFAEAAGEAARAMRDEINAALAQVGRHGRSGDLPHRRRAGGAGR